MSGNYSGCTLLLGEGEFVLYISPLNYAIKTKKQDGWQSAKLLHRNFTFPALPGLHSLPATAFAIRLWARFAFRQKHRLSGDCSLFPQKLCFCGSPELLSARTVTMQKYHCPDISSLPQGSKPLLQCRYFSLG